MILGQLAAWFNRIRQHETTASLPLPPPPKRPADPSRIGALGEYKIDVQLSQLRRGIRYASDLLLANPRSKTGYSQIDHVVITPYALFVIETKNYRGEIQGQRRDKFWRVDGRRNLRNPLNQNYGHCKILQQTLPEYPTLLFVSIIAFSLRCRFSVDPELRQIGSNELVIYDVELSEYIERKIRRLQSEYAPPPWSQSDIDHIYQLVSLANLTDPSPRAEHIRLARALNSH